MTDFFDRLTGVWTFEGRNIPDDGKPPRTGDETVTRNGAWAVIESTYGVRFQLAFDPASGRVTGDFVAWEDPTLWTYDGVIEGGVMTLAARGPSFDVEGQITDYEDIWEILSPDERVLTGRLKGADGQWRDFTQTRYRRKDPT